MATASDSEEQAGLPQIADIFANFDLKAEAPEARKPSVRYIFEFPELLAAFLPADKTAMDARHASRIAGVAAVVLVLAALLLASLGPILSSGGHAPASDHPPAEEGLNVHLILGIVSAGLGLAGTLLGLSGMRLSASRRKWLRSRLKTEMLRLYHFHHIAARLPEILLIGTDEARRKKYLEERAAGFEQLKSRVLSDPEAELKRIMARQGETRFESITPAQPATGVDIPPIAQDVFDVWQVLRINWQAGFCEAKLGHRHKGRVTTRQLEEVFMRLGWFCVGAIILIHIVYFVGVVGLSKGQLTYLEGAVIWMALIALGGRALEDGYRSQAEVERYEQYRANVRVAEERLKEATTLPAKLEAIRAFERVSLEEMRVFLRTHARARFLL